MTTKKSRAVVVAALCILCIVFLFPFRAWAQGYEDDSKQMSVSAAQFVICVKARRESDANLVTSQKATTQLQREVEACEKIVVIKKVGTDYVAVAKQAVAKPPAPAPLPAPLPPPPPAPKVDPLKCKPCEEIEVLKARVEKLEKGILAVIDAKKGDEKSPDLERLNTILKRLEELVKQLEEDPASVANIAKKFEEVHKDYAELLVRVGMVEFFTEGMRKLLCSENPTTEKEVLAFCGATQVVIDVGLKGHGKWFPGAPGKFGVAAELAVTYFPGAGPSGFTFGASGGLLQGAKWAKDTSYFVRGFAGGTSCTDSSRSTCFRILGFVEGLTWVRPANGSDIDPKARAGLKGPPSALGCGLSVGVVKHLTKRSWFSVDVEPLDFTLGANHFTSDGKVGVYKGWYSGVAVGFGGTFDAF